jgi:predicted DNA-binding transcriptional regulator AlpA
MNEIVGWDELIRVVGRCENVIRRLIRFNDFPRPVERGRKHRWDRLAVERWLATNELPSLKGRRRSLYPIHQSDPVELSSKPEPYPALHSLLHL